MEPPARSLNRDEGSIQQDASRQPSTFAEHRARWAAFAARSLDRTRERANLPNTRTGSMPCDSVMTRRPGCACFQTARSIASLYRKPLRGRALIRIRVHFDAKRTLVRFEPSPWGPIRLQCVYVG